MNTIIYKYFLDKLKDMKHVINGIKVKTCANYIRFVPKPQFPIDKVDGNYPHRLSRWGFRASTLLGMNHPIYPQATVPID